MTAAAKKLNIQIPTLGWRRSPKAEASYREHHGVEATAYVVDHTGGSGLLRGISIVVAVAGDDPIPFATLSIAGERDLRPLLLEASARCWMNARECTGELTGLSP